MRIRTVLILVMSLAMLAGVGAVAVNAEMNCGPGLYYMNGFCMNAPAGGGGSTGMNGFQRV